MVETFDSIRNFDYSEFLNQIFTFGNNGSINLGIQIRANHMQDVLVCRKLKIEPYK